MSMRDIIISMIYTRCTDGIESHIGRIRVVYAGARHGMRSHNIFSDVAIRYMT